MKQWWQELFSEADQKMIENAVAEAEKITNAEIVPMVVRRSSGGEEQIRGPLIGLFIGWCVGYGLELLGIHFGFAPLFSLIFGAVFYLFIRFTDFGRFFLSFGERNNSANIRAELEFYRHKLSNTQNRTGVLLFISVFDHQVVILGDEAIANAIPRESWSETCENIIQGIKRKAFAQHMVSSISKMGIICGQKFPPIAGDRNEINNLMVVKD